jgi:prepilin peptidase CpaA
VVILLNAYLLFIFVIICLFTDLSERKIYNPVVLGGTLAALVINMLQLGVLDGFTYTAAGMFTGIFLLIMPFIAGGLGAGDVKMLGMIGAFVGYEMVVQVLLVSALVGGLYALFAMVVERRLFRGMWKLFIGLIMFVLTRKTVYLYNMEDNRGDRAMIPYGAALSAGVIIIYIMGSLNYNLPGFSLPAFF